MFEDQYNDEMAAEVLRLEAKQRAAAAGRPEWENACGCCRVELRLADGPLCPACAAAEKSAG